MTLLPSSLLLSPDGGLPVPSGASIIAAAKLGARARMMGVKAIQRHLFTQATDGEQHFGRRVQLGGAFEMRDPSQPIGKGIRGHKRLRSTTDATLFRTPTRMPLPSRFAEAGPPSTSEHSLSSSPTRPRKSPYPRALTQMLHSPSKCFTPSQNPAHPIPAQSSSLVGDDLLYSAKPRKCSHMNLVPTSFTVKAALLDQAESGPRPRPIADRSTPPPPERRRLSTTFRSTSVDDDDDLIVQRFPSESPKTESPRSKFSRENRRALMFPSSSIGSPLSTKKKTLETSSLLRQGQGNITSTKTVDAFAKLASLHASLERALMLHFATDGGGTFLGHAFSSVLTSPSHKANETTEVADCDQRDVKVVKLPNLVAFPVLRPVIERGSNRQFTAADLGNLMWVWGANPLYGWSDMGFLVTPFSTSKKARHGRGLADLPFGLGIELMVRSNVTSVNTPSLELLSGGAAYSTPTNVKKCYGNGRALGRESMTAVALWSAGAEERRKEVGRRLRMIYKAGKSIESACLPMSSSTAHGRRPAEVSERGFDDESVEEGMMVGQQSPLQGRALKCNNLKSRSTSPTPILRSTNDALQRSLMITPTKRRSLLTGNSVPLEKRQKLVSTSEQSTPLTTAVRAQSLMERIKAKEEARATHPTPFLTPPESASQGSRLKKSFLGEKAAELRHRSIMSRLPDIADAIFMLFNGETGGAIGGATAPMSPSRGGTKRAARLSEVAQSIVKSSKVSLSIYDAEDAIRFLARISPDFITLVKRGLATVEEWVTLSARARDPGGKVLAEVKERIRAELEM